MDKNFQRQINLISLFKSKVKNILIEIKENN